MSKPRHSPVSRKRTYSEQQSAGLHAHTSAQKQSTVDRLKAAIASLLKQKKPISVRTIREECGLEYNSIKRNSEALSIFQEHSTFLKTKRIVMKASKTDTSVPRDPFLAYKKSQLVRYLREEIQLQREMQAQHVQLLEAVIQKDLKIAELESKLARYEGKMGGLRIFLQKQEHSD